jgi:hypothetical protein
VKETKLKVKANNQQGIVELLQQQIANDLGEKTTDKKRAIKKLLLRKTGSRKVIVVLIVPPPTKIHTIIPSKYIP